MCAHVHLDVCVRVMRISCMHDLSVFGKVDQASSLLKGRTFFYIRDETYADAFTREVAERSVGKDTLYSEEWHARMQT